MAFAFPRTFRIDEYLIRRWKGHGLIRRTLFGGWQHQTVGSPDQRHRELSVSSGKRLSVFVFEISPSLPAACCGSSGNRGEAVRERERERQSEGVDERRWAFPHPHLNSVRGASLSRGERPQTRLLPNTGTVSKGDICAGGAAQANIRGKERS